MDNNKFYGEDDLVLNTASRVPVCLCLDTSGSMNKDGAIDKLNEGIKVFYEAIKADEQAAMSCEIAVVTFNSEVTVEEDFSLVDTKEPKAFTANGGTAMAHGVEKALDLLDERKRKYKENGVNYYQPWLVLITDGKPGDMEDIPAAQARTKGLMESKKLVIFPIAVGNDDDSEKSHAIMDVLNGFCTRPKARHLKGLKFEELFEWLGKSLSTVAASQNGETVKLDVSTIDDWSEV